MKILFIDNVHNYLLNLLRKDGHECIEAYNASYEELVGLVKDVHGIIIRSRIMLDEKFLQHAGSLVFIARAGAGMESIDIVYARKRNIICLNSPEGNRNAVAEHAMGMLLSLLNNLNKADAEVRRGDWIRDGNRGHELAGKTVGIVGVGNTGNAFAEKLHGFNCTILGYDKYKSGFGNDIIREVFLEELFEHADVLSIHVPLTPETEYFIDDTFINKFRKKFYFINTARGRCVRTTDLVINLKSGKIPGACLDVVEYEDTSFENMSVKENFEHPSWKYLTSSFNVILSPHIAGWTFESHLKISKVLYEKIIQAVTPQGF